MRTGPGRWAVPVFALLMGGAMFGAAWVGGRFMLGVGFIAIMAAYAALLSLGGRFDVVRVLRGQPADERYRSFDVRASAFAGLVTLAVLIGYFLYEIARGQDGQPYALICGVAGVGYVAALFWFSRRS